MGDALKKVQPGQPLQIPAAAYNAFVDAALDYRQRQQDRGGPTPSGGRPSGVVLVRNASGADRQRFDVLGIDSVVFTPPDALEQFQNQPVLEGVTPTAAHAGRFVILQEPLAAGPEGDPANGAIGRALLSGLSVARIEVAADADAFADIKAGDATQLRSGSSGAAQVLWKETTGATRWAIVRLGLATASAGPVLIFDQWIHWDTHQAKVYLSEDGTAAKAQDLRGHCIALSAAYRFRSDVAGAQTEACWPAYSALVHYQLGPNWSGATDARFWQSSGGTGLGYVYGYIEAGTGKVYLQFDKYPEGGGYTNTDIQMRVVVWRYRALLEPGIVA